MSHIKVFLPQYRELNTLLANIVNSGTVSYNQQVIITLFYEKFSDAKEFEEMIIDVILEKDKAIATQLLSRIKTEVQNNIQLYESAKEILDSIDAIHICALEVRRFNPIINFQLKKTQDHWAEVRDIDRQLDSIGFRKHAQWEEDKLQQQREVAMKYYDIEKKTLSQYYDEQRTFQKEASKYTHNLFNNIYSLSLAFLKIVSSYITHKASTTEEKIKKTKNKVNPTLSTETEGDVIFMTNGLKNLLILEKRLIADNYLSEDLHWIATHENRTIDKKKLITFLTGLVENKYFLPNRDPKIRAFFESRYHISIGQNFEKKRREPLVAEYKVVFYNYPF